MQAGCPGIPRRPGSAARADGIRFGRKGTAEPSGRGASSRRRFCRRSSSTRRGWSRFQGRRASVSASKIRPGPGSAVEADVRTRIPSAPAPLRHRDSAHEGPPSRSSTARVVLPYPISTTHLGRVCSSGRRSASHPRARKTSDLPPGIGISIAPSILISTKQQNNKTTQQQNRTTGNQKTMNSGRQDFSTSCRQDFRTSVSTEVSHSVSTDVNQSVTFWKVEPSGPIHFDRFCSRSRFRERTVRLFRLAGEQAGTGRDIRPVFESPEHYMFRDSASCVFSYAK